MADTTISFIRSLCGGEIEQDVLFPYPTLDADSRETLSAVLEAVDQLLGRREEAFARWDVEGALPPEFIDELRQFGLFGLIVPEAHGGLEMGNMAYSRTLQQIARYDASVAVTVGAHSSIGMRGLKLFGTDEQKARYYDKLATGEMIAAFCLTEAGAGSDAASVRTTAVEQADGFLLNGSKIWITNAGIADFFTVFAKTGEAEERAHLSAFIVTRDMPGVSVGTHEEKMGLRASSTCTVYLEDVLVPKENLLGPRDGGFKVAMNILNSGRSGLGGGCIGAMKRLIALSAAHATERKQFGQPISEFGLIKQKIGHMVVDCYAAESAVTAVAALSDQGYDDYSVEAAITKVFASEALWRSADEGLQISGGSGYMRELPYERIVRDSRINRIFEGTNEVLRLFIALTALNDVGKRLKELSGTVSGIFEDPIKGFGVLYDYARRRAHWATGRGGKRLTKVHVKLRPEADLFEDLTRNLAAMADRLLRKHKKAIINKQFALRRLADVMVDLFVLATVLSRVTAAIESRGEEAAADEIAIAQVFAGQVRGRVSRNFHKIDANDDGLIKTLAVHTCERGGYPWDAV
ncbi:MAG: acyl-CoA dehydrogenase family protein [Deltaproteobacteria bacterium]|nr:acyl-CoA dehydrogenase family protein [Deltaproteobacteria bacterium]